MKRALLLLALFTQATFGAVPAPYPLTVDSQSASAPMLQLYRASPRTIRVQFTDGGTAADLTGLTTNDLHLTWATSNASPAFVASDVAIVNATNGQADFTFTSGDLNYAQGRYIYEAAAGSTVVKQGALIILGSPFSTGTNSPAWTTNINLSGYTFINYPWLTDAPSDGSIYGRQDGGWAAVTGGGGGSTTDTTARAWAVGASNLALSAYGAASNAAAAATNAHTLAATASNLAASAVAGLPSLVALSNGVIAVGLAATNAGNTAAQAQVLGSNALAVASAAATGTPLYVESDPLSLPLAGGVMTGPVTGHTFSVTNAGMPALEIRGAKLFINNTNAPGDILFSESSRELDMNDGDIDGVNDMQINSITKRLAGQYIEIASTLNGGGNAASNFVFYGDGSGLTNLPAAAQSAWTIPQDAGSQGLSNLAWVTSHGNVYSTNIFPDGFVHLGGLENIYPMPITTQTVDGAVVLGGNSNRFAATTMLGAAYVGGRTNVVNSGTHNGAGWLGGDNNLFQGSGSHSAMLAGRRNTIANINTMIGAGEDCFSSGGYSLTVGRGTTNFASNYSFNWGYYSAVRSAVGSMAGGDRAEAKASESIAIGSMVDALQRGAAIIGAPGSAFGSGGTRFGSSGTNTFTWARYDRLLVGKTSNDLWGVVLTKIVTNAHAPAYTPYCEGAVLIIVGTNERTAIATDPTTNGWRLSPTLTAP